jgi:hypothetical protein
MKLKPNHVFVGTKFIRRLRSFVLPMKSVELDWIEGEFFDTDRLYLVCTTHSARYDPVTGRCAGGPCAGRGLIRLEVVEEGGDVRLDNDCHRINQ